MKKALSMLLVLCLALSLGGTVLASGEPSGSAKPAGNWMVYAPEAYENGTGVVNGYYADVAPIIVTEDASDADALTDRGFVVVETDDFASAVKAIRAGSVTGDPDCIILRGGTAAAEAAASLGVYAAQLSDPIVQAEADPEAVKTALEKSARDYAMRFAEVTITEPQNTTIISGEDRSVIESAFPGAVFDWTASGEMSGEPSGEASDDGSEEAEEEERFSDVRIELPFLPLEFSIPADAPVIEPGDSAPQFVRVNWDIKNENGSYAAAYGLAESFRDAGSVVQLNYIFDSSVSDTDAFCNWVDRICQAEREFTPDEIGTILDLGNSLATGEAVWTLSGGCYVLTGTRHIGVVDIARPELPDYQGVSVAVPAALSGCAGTVYSGMVPVRMSRSSAQDLSAPFDFARNLPIGPWTLITPARASIPHSVVMSLKPTSHLGFAASSSSGSISAKRIVP